MTDTTAEDFIEHAGVKGMKWGVRKGAYRRTMGAIGKRYRENGAQFVSDATKRKIQGGTAIVGAAVLAAPALRTYGDLAVRALGSAALKVAENRGARAAASSMLSIGSKVAVQMVQGSDGTWR